MSRLKRLIHEAHRRSLWQVLGIYLGGSWVVFEAVGALIETAGLPDWVTPFTLVLLMIGLPVVLATAFVQEGMPGRAGPAPAPAAEAHAVPEAEADVTPPSAGAPQSALFTWRNAIAGGVGAFALLGLLTVGFLVARATGIGPAGTLVAKGVLDERARLIVADFGGSEGDLAATAAAAMRVDFGQSRVVQLVSRAEVAEVLQRMGRDHDTRLDARVAREVAVREGIPAVVTGQISAAGTGYLLAAELLDAESGDVLTAAREAARDSTELVEAVDGLSKRLRERIGESLRTLQGEEPLERVTTPSLPALRKYSQALHTIDVLGDEERGITLLEEAVALDSGFAMAHRRIGAILGNRAQQRAREVKALSAAFRHRDRLTEKERYHAEALYYFNIAGEVENALNAYRNLVELYPSDAYALNNLGVMYAFLRDHARAQQYYEAAIAADSNSSLSYTNAAAEMYKQGKAEEARAMLELHGRRFPDNPATLDFRALWAAAEGDYEEAGRLVREQRREMAGNQFWRWRTSWDLWALAAIRGRLQEARGHMADAMAAQEARDAPGDALSNAAELALAELYAGADPERAVQALEEARDRFPVEEMPALDRPYTRMATVYAAAGDLARARASLAAYDEAVPDALRDWLVRYYRDLAVGEIALAEGRPDEALRAFRRADVGFCLPCARPFLGRAHEAAGRPDSALAHYEAYIETPWPWRARFDDPLQRGWLLERLGQLHDARGDLDAAARYYAMFVELWAEADEALQPRVRAAQERLQQIVTERG